MIPFYNPDGTCRPLGLPMSQNRMAVPTWSYAMEVHPPHRIIEIGTNAGGFTVSIGIHARQIGAELVTYDLAFPSEDLGPLMHLLGIRVRIADVWQAEGEIGAFIAMPGITYVLCDGGDKPRELATFARYLKPGDVIASHDYDADHHRDPSIPLGDRPWQWSEIFKSQGDAVAASFDLEPFMQEHFDLAGWLAYKKR